MPVFGGQPSAVIVCSTPRQNPHTPQIGRQPSAVNVDSTAEQNLHIPIFPVEQNRLPELPSVPCDSLPGRPLPKLPGTSPGQH
jgi:hypothetical protein